MYSCSNDCVCQCVRLCWRKILSQSVNWLKCVDIVFMSSVKKNSKSYSLGNIVSDNGIWQLDFVCCCGCLCSDIIWICLVAFRLQRQVIDIQKIFAPHFEGIADEMLNTQFSFGSPPLNDQIIQRLGNKHHKNVSHIEQKWIRLDLNWNWIWCKGIKVDGKKVVKRIVRRIVIWPKPGRHT